MFAHISLLLNKLVNGFRQVLQDFCVSCLNGLHDTMIDVILQNHFANIVDGSPHSGELDQHLAAVAPFLYHFLYTLQMSNGTGKSVDHFLCFGVGMCVRLIHKKASLSYPPWGDMIRITQAAG